MKLWPRPIPRRMRFHDLRHTTATLLLRAGVDVHRVQRILRHKDISTTADTYSHLIVDDLRDAMDRFIPTPPPSSPDPTIPTPAQLAVGADPLPQPHLPPLAANLLLETTKGAEPSVPAPSIY